MSNEVDLFDLLLIIHFCKHGLKYFYILVIFFWQYDHNLFIFFNLIFDFLTNKCDGSKKKLIFWICFLVYFK